MPLGWYVACSGCGDPELDCSLAFPHAQETTKAWARREERSSKRRVGRWAYRKNAASLWMTRESAFASHLSLRAELACRRTLPDDPTVRWSTEAVEAAVRGYIERWSVDTVRLRPLPCSARLTFVST